mmetsp:Transcript_87653/g.151860  ORF Transcript_87653/g.151860 Transcript_87653/m.151860 type:complete len:538 (+) Transcript_87653:95-1708(+)
MGVQVSVLASESDETSTGIDDLLDHLQGSELSELCDYFKLERQKQLSNISSSHGPLTPQKLWWHLQFSAALKQIKHGWVHSRRLSRKRSHSSIPVAMPLPRSPEELAQLKRESYLFRLGITRRGQSPGKRFPRRCKPLSVLKATEGESCEWMKSFKAAGIPRVAIESIESTSTQSSFHSFTAPRATEPNLSVSSLESQPEPILTPRSRLSFDEGGHITPPCTPGLPKSMSCASFSTQWTLEAMSTAVKTMSDLGELISDDEEDEESEEIEEEKDDEIDENAEHKAEHKTEYEDECEDKAEHKADSKVERSAMPFHLRSSDSKIRMQFLKKLSYEGVWLPKALRPPKHQTVIIFDWDDTLLCSSFLQFRQGGPLPSDVKRTLKSMAKNVTTLLELALSLGKTFIVTNAVSGWVEQSATDYMPEILPVLQRVKVLSARSRYEAEYPDEVDQWKTRTFLELQQQLDSQVITNLVSVGDSFFEREAAMKMGREFAEVVVKTIKFQEFPTPKELHKQQQHLCKQFPQIVGSAKDLRMRMRPR